MAEPVPYQVLQAIATQLSVISVDGGYNTDIGTQLRIHDKQRDDSAIPSIAIGSTSGQLSLAAERTSNGGSKSPRARRADITIEAAAPAALADEQHVAHLMLEDIERAFAIDTRLSPYSVRGLKLTSWSILPREPGANSVVLQILGSADYVRPQT